MKQLWAPWRLRFILNSSDLKKEKEGCVFCELPKQKNDDENLIVKRGNHCFIIMNKFPYNRGHLMVVPYQHTSRLDTLSDDVLLEVHREIKNSLSALEKCVQPAGFNVGMNLGEAGGAGIRDHLHYHIVPRWNGDTNFMPVFGETKVMPESLEDTLKRLKPHFS